MRGPGAVAQRLQRLQLGQRTLDGLGAQARAATAQIGQRPQHAGQAFGAAQAAAAAPHQVALAQRQQRLQRRGGDFDRQARTAAAHPGLHGFVLILARNAFAEGEAQRQIGQVGRAGHHHRERRGVVFDGHGDFLGQFVQRSPARAVAPAPDRLSGCTRMVHGGNPN